jgi:uncharacterized protein with WD repeat
MPVPDDDAIIDDILNESSSSYDIKDTNNKNKEMSTDGRDIIGRKNPTSAISREEAEKITEWKNLQRINAEFKKKHGLQGYSMDDILPEGNKLVINEEKVKQRKEKEKQMIEKMIEDQKKSPKAVKHTIDGKTAVYGAEVPTQ